MKTQMSVLRWLRAFFIRTLALVLLLMSLMYIVDPFFRFRVRDNSYMLNPRYVNAGLIRNYDYDSLMIGSSMTQNFHMDLFREALDCKPLHLSMGGLSPLETVELLELAESVGRAEEYYISIDLQCFNLPTDSSNNPDYLLRSDPLSTARYLLSYEAWFRFLPVDMGFLALKAAGVELPDKFARSTSIDLLANWEHDFSYGEQAVLENAAGAYAVSEVELENLRDRLNENFELLFDSVEKVERKITFFFPPYSMLFWHNSSAYMDVYLDAKADFIRRAEAMGHSVFDFQAAPLCMDLSHYRDSSHYSGEINDYMTLCFADGSWLCGSGDIEEYRRQLCENLDAFREKYSDILQ